MISEFENNNYSEVLLFVPEITLGYFLSQCPFFKTVHKRYVIGNETFFSIINQTVPIPDTPENQSDDDDQAVEKNGSSCESDSSYLFDEELQFFKKGLLLVGGLIAVVGIGICVKKLKNIL